MPLHHKKILITRAPHQAEELAQLLREKGGVPLLYPCIDMAPPWDTAVLDAALVAAVHGEFDWLVLTSANTVAILAQRLAALGLALPAGKGLQVAAVGPATAAAARANLRVVINSVPEEHVAEALASAIGVTAGTRLLLPQSAKARPLLARQLREQGALVTAVVAYDTVPGQGGVDAPALLRARQIDAVTFTSASTVTNFLLRLANEGGRRADLAGVCLACLGPVTAAAVADAGLLATVTAAEYTLPGLVSVLEECFHHA
jgi:uroporphyrinogen-III synthase